MAQKFNIVAQLQLQGPSNLNQVVSQIQSKLKNVNANINFNVSKNAASQAQQAASAAQNLGKSSAAAQKQVSQLSKASKQAGASASQASKGMIEAASAAEAFGKQSALAVKRFAAFSVSAGILGGFVASIKNGISAAIDFERELVKVSQVTGKSIDALSALTNQISALSKGMGVASAELVNVSRILSQTGMTADEVRISLKTLAQSSLAPTFKDMANTAEGAIAIMRQFGVTADGLGKKLGSINALASQFAVESQDLIFAIRRAGGAFQAAGGQLEELLALFTSVRATTRESAETIATGFRTIFTRMQRPKTIEFLRQAGVELQNLEGNFVGPYEAVKRLSHALRTLESTDPRFAKIVEELGGFRQVSKVIPLIQQFATAQRALAVAQQGQGSLARDAAKAQETLAVKIMKVREEFLTLFREIAQSKTFKVFADVALNMASSLIKVGDSLKPVLPLLASLAAFQGIKMATQFTGGFVQGMKGAGGQQGGGARGVGRAVAGGVTGQASAQNAIKHIQALSTNTQALNKVSGSLTSTNTQIKQLITSLSALPKNLRLSLGGAGGVGRGRGFNTGGVVPGSGNRDTVPAMLTPGEFVIRKSSVQKYGVENLQKLNTGGKKLGDVSRGRRLSGGAKGASYADSRQKRFAKRMGGGSGKAYAFDFDDTLAESDAVEKPGSADPYEDFRGKKGASFVRSARATKIASMARTRASRGHDIYVVTARPNDKSTRSSIGHFMRGVGAPAKDVIGVGGTPGPGGTDVKKAQVLARLKKQYGNIVFLDDNDENVLAASKVPGVKSIKARKMRFGGSVGISSPTKPEKNKHLEFEKGRLKRQKDQAYRRQLYKPQITGRNPGAELSMALMGMQINEIEKLTDYKRYTSEQRTKQLQYETRQHKARIRALKALSEDQKGPAFRGMVPSVSYEKLKKYVASHGQKWPEGYRKGGVIQRFKDGDKVEDIKLESIPGGAAGIKKDGASAKSIGKHLAGSVSVNVKDADIDASKGFTVQGAFLRPVGENQSRRTFLQQKDIAKLAMSGGRGGLRRFGETDVGEFKDKKPEDIKKEKIQFKYNNKEYTYTGLKKQIEGEVNTAFTESEFSKYLSDVNIGSDSPNVKQTIKKAIPINVKAGALKKEAEAEFVSGLKTKIKEHAQTWTTQNVPGAGWSDEGFNSGYSKANVEQIEGNIFEAAIAGVIGDKWKDRGKANAPFDFPTGLGAASSSFNLDSDVMTDTKRTLTTESMDSIVKKAGTHMASEIALAANPQKEYEVKGRDGITRKEMRTEGIQDLRKKAMGGMIQRLSVGGKKKPFRFFQNFSRKPIKKDGVKGKEKEKPKRDFSGSEIAIRNQIITARYAKGSGKSGTVTASKMFGKIWEVNSSQATKGFGPNLYDLVMEGATSKGGMLVSDRASVSDAARRVWDFYYSKRPDVQKHQLKPAEWEMKVDMNKFPSEDPATWPPKSDVASWSLKHGYTKAPNLINKSNVKHYAKGGAASDTVPALLTPGEFVVNKSSAQRIGYGNLHRINTGRAPVQGFAKGGLVQSLHKGGPVDDDEYAEYRKQYPKTKSHFVPGIGEIMPDDPTHPDMGGLDVVEGDFPEKPAKKTVKKKKAAAQEKAAVEAMRQADSEPPFRFFQNFGQEPLLSPATPSVPTQQGPAPTDPTMGERIRGAAASMAGGARNVLAGAGRGASALKDKVTGGAKLAGQAFGEMGRDWGGAAMDAGRAVAGAAGKVGGKLAGGAKLAGQAFGEMGQDWGGLAMDAGRGTAKVAAKVGGAALDANRAVGDTIEAGVVKSLEASMKGLTKVVTASAKGTKDLGTKIANGAKATKDMASKLKEGAKSVAGDVAGLGMRQYEQDFGSDITHKDAFYADAAKKGRGKREALVRHAQEKRDAARENVKRFSGMGVMGRMAKKTAGAENVLATQRKGLKGALAGFDEKARDKGAVLIAKAFDKAESVGKKLVDSGKKSIANIKDNIKTLKQNIASRRQASQNRKRNLAQFGGMGGGMGAQAQKTAAANQGMFGRMRSRIGGMFGGGRRGGGGGAGAAAGGAGQGGGGGGGGGGMDPAYKLQMAMMLAANATQVLGQMFGKMPPGLERMIGAVNQSIITFQVLKQTLAMVGAMGKSGGLLSKLQGPLGSIIAGFVALGMTVKSFGDTMKEEALEKAKTAKTEAEAAEALKEYQKGAGVSNIGTGMAIGGGVGALAGGALGSLLGPMGTIIGASVGGVVGSALGGITANLLEGYMGPSKEIINALQQGRMNRNLTTMSKHLKQIEKHGLTTSRALSVSRGASAIAQNIDLASTENYESFKQQGQQQLPALEAFVTKMSEGANSVADFERKMGGAGKRTLEAIAKIKGIPYDELKKELADEIAMRKKVRDAEKAQQEAAKAHRDLTGEVYGLRDAFKQATAAIGELSTISDAVSTLYSGGDIAGSATGMGAVKSGVLGRAAAGENVDPARLEKAIQQTAPNDAVAAQAREAAKVNAELPKILTQLAIDSGGSDEKLTTQFSDALKNNNIDPDSAIGKGLVANLQTLTAERQKSEGSAVDDIRTDPRAVAEKLIGDATPELLSALESVGNEIIKTQEELNKMMSARNKLEAQATKERLKLANLQNDLADTEAQLSGAVPIGQEASLATAKARDMQKQQIILGAGSSGVDASAMAGDPAQLGNALRATNQAMLQGRQAMADATGASVGEMAAMQAGLHGMQEGADRTRAALEELANGGQALAKVQSDLAKATKDREFRRDKMVSEVIFGDEESQKGFARDVSGAQALAQGIVDPQQLPKSMRQSTLSFLKGLGDQKQEFLGGKSGNEVVRESSERQLRKMFAPQLASGNMSEQGFQDMVSAYFDASKTEKDLLKELKKQQEIQVAAQKELLATTQQGIDTQDLLVAQAVAAGDKAVVDALNRVEVMQAEANRMAAAQRAADAAAQLKSVQDLERTTGVTGEAAKQQGSLALEVGEDAQKVFDQERTIGNASGLLSGGFVDQKLYEKRAREKHGAGLGGALNTAADWAMMAQSFGQTTASDIALRTNKNNAGNSWWSRIAGNRTASRDTIRQSAAEVGQSGSFDLAAELQDMIISMRDTENVDIKDPEARSDIMGRVRGRIEERMGKQAFEGEDGQKLLNQLTNQLSDLLSGGIGEDESNTLIGATEQISQAAAIIQGRANVANTDRQNIISGIQSSEMNDQMKAMFMDIIQGRGEYEGKSTGEREEALKAELNKIGQSLETIGNAGGIGQIQQNVVRTQDDLRRADANLADAQQGQREGRRPEQGPGSGMVFRAPLPGGGTPVPPPVDPRASGVPATTEETPTGETTVLASSPGAGGATTPTVTVDPETGETVATAAPTGAAAGAPSIQGSELLTAQAIGEASTILQTISADVKSILGILQSGSGILSDVAGGAEGPAKVIGDTVKGVAEGKAAAADPQLKKLIEEKGPSSAPKGNVNVKEFARLGASAGIDAPFVVGREKAKTPVNVPTTSADDSPNPILRADDTVSTRVSPNTIPSAGFPPAAQQAFAEVKNASSSELQKLVAEKAKVMETQSMHADIVQQASPLAKPYAMLKHAQLERPVKMASEAVSQKKRQIAQDPQLEALHKKKESLEDSKLKMMSTSMALKPFGPIGMMAGQAGDAMTEMKVEPLIANIEGQIAKREDELFGKGGTSLLTEVSKGVEKGASSSKVINETRKAVEKGSSAPSVAKAVEKANVAAAPKVAQVSAKAGGAPMFAPPVTMPTGTMPSGAIPPVTMPSGVMPSGAIPPVTMPSGTMPTGTSAIQQGLAGQQQLIQAAMQQRAGGGGILFGGGKDPFRGTPKAVGPQGAAEDKSTLDTLLEANNMSKEEYAAFEAYQAGAPVSISEPTAVPTAGAAQVAQAEAQTQGASQLIEEQAQRALTEGTIPTSLPTGAKKIADTVLGKTPGDLEIPTEADLESIDKTGEEGSMFDMAADLAPKSIMPLPDFTKEVAPPIEEVAEEKTKAETAKVVEEKAKAAPPPPPELTEEEKKADARRRHVQKKLAKMTPAQAEYFAETGDMNVGHFGEGLETVGDHEKGASFLRQLTAGNEGTEKHSYSVRRYRELQDRADAASFQAEDIEDNEQRNQATLHARRLQQEADTFKMQMFTDEQGVWDAQLQEKAERHGLTVGKTKEQLEKEHAERTARIDAENKSRERNPWAVGGEVLLDRVDQLTDTAVGGIGTVGGALQTAGFGIAEGVEGGFNMLTGREDNWMRAGRQQSWESTKAMAEQTAKGATAMVTGDHEMETGVYREKVIDQMQEGALKDWSSGALTVGETFVPMGPGLGGLKAIPGVARMAGAGGKMLKSGLGGVAKGAGKMGSKFVDDAGRVVTKGAGGFAQTMSPLMQKAMYGTQKFAGGAVDVVKKGAKKTKTLASDAMTAGARKKAMQQAKKIEEFKKLVSPKTGKGIPAEEAAKRLNLSSKALREGGQTASAKLIDDAAAKAAAKQADDAAAAAAKQSDDVATAAAKQSDEVVESGAKQAGKKAAKKTGKEVLEQTVKPKKGIFGRAMDFGKKWTKRAAVAGGTLATGAVVALDQAKEYMSNLDISGIKRQEEIDLKMGGKGQFNPGYIEGGGTTAGMSEEEIARARAEAMQQAQAQQRAAPTMERYVSRRGSAASAGPSASAKLQAQGLEVQRQLASSERHKRGGGGIDYSHPVQQKRFAKAIAKRKEVMAKRIDTLRSAGVDTQGMSQEDINRKSRRMEHQRKKDMEKDKAVVGDDDKALTDKLMGKDLGTLGMPGQEENLKKAKERTSQKIAELRKAGVDVDSIESKKDLNEQYAELAADKKAEWYATYDPNKKDEPAPSEEGQGLIAKGKAAIQKGMEFGGDMLQKGKSIMQDPMAAAKQGLAALGLGGKGKGETLTDEGRQQVLAELSEMGGTGKGMSEWLPKSKGEMEALGTQDWVKNLGKEGDTLGVDLQRIAAEQTAKEGLGVAKKAGKVPGAAGAIAAKGKAQAQKLGKGAKDVGKEFDISSLKGMKRSDRQDFGSTLEQLRKDPRLTDEQREELEAMSPGQFAVMSDRGFEVFLDDYSNLESKPQAESKPSGAEFDFAALKGTKKKDRQNLDLEAMRKDPRLSDKDRERLTKASARDLGVMNDKQFDSYMDQLASRVSGKGKPQAKAKAKAQAQKLGKGAKDVGKEFDFAGEIGRARSDRGGMDERFNKMLADPRLTDEERAEMSKMKPSQFTSMRTGAYDEYMGDWAKKLEGRKSKTTGPGEEGEADFFKGVTPTDETQPGHRPGSDGPRWAQPLPGLDSEPRTPLEKKFAQKKQKKQKKQKQLTHQEAAKTVARRAFVAPDQYLEGGAINPEWEKHQAENKRIMDSALPKGVKPGAGSAGLTDRQKLNMQNAQNRKRGRGGGPGGPTSLNQAAHLMGWDQSQATTSVSYGPMQERWTDASGKRIPKPQMSGLRQIPGPGQMPGGLGPMMMSGPGGAQGLQGMTGGMGGGGMQMEQMMQMMAAMISQIGGAKGGAPGEGAIRIPDEQIEAIRQAFSTMDPESLMAFSETMKGFTENNQLAESLNLFNETFGGGKIQHELTADGISVNINGLDAIQGDMEQRVMAKVLSEIERKQKELTDGKPT